MSRFPRLLAILLILGSLAAGALRAPPLPAAGNDNDVEWNGVSSTPRDRSPVFPARNQAFTVELRVFTGDITAARVRTWDGAERRFDLS